MTSSPSINEIPSIRVTTWKTIFYYHSIYYERFCTTYYNNIVQTKNGAVFSFSFNLNKI